MIVALGRGRLDMDAGARTAALKPGQFALFDSLGSVVADTQSRMIWDPTTRNAARLAEVLARTPSPEATEIHCEVERVAGSDSVIGYPSTHVRVRLSYHRSHVLDGVAELDGATVTTTKDYWFVHAPGIPENALTPLASTHASDSVSKVFDDLRKPLREYGVAVRSLTETTISVEDSKQVSTTRLEITQLQPAVVSDAQIVVPVGYIDSADDGGVGAKPREGPAVASLRRWFQLPSP
ncbi:MAG TPA: hypothetical protein VGM82_00085 [Gemmatimonadaceae bacterium]